MEYSMFWSDLENRASHPNQEVREVTLPWDLTLIIMAITNEQKGTDRKPELLRQN